MIRRYALLIAALSVVASAAVPSGDEQAGPAVLSGPGSFSAGYYTPVMAAQVGGTLTNVNTDIQRHDVVSKDSGPILSDTGSLHLFASSLVGIGGSSPVRGLENLEAGKVYEFYCSIHPNMKGRLVALPA